MGNSSDSEGEGGGALPSRSRAEPCCVRGEEGASASLASETGTGMPRGNCFSSAGGAESGVGVENEHLPPPPPPPPPPTPPPPPRTEGEVEGVRYTLYLPTRDISFAPTPERADAALLLRPLSPPPLGASSLRQLRLDEAGRGDVGGGAGPSSTAPAQDPSTTTADSRSLQQLRRIAQEGLRHLEQMLREVEQLPDPDLQVQLPPNQQRYGLSWLRWREQGGESGGGAGILVDETGLGKAAMMSALFRGRTWPGSLVSGGLVSFPLTMVGSTGGGRHHVVRTSGTLIVCTTAEIDIWVEAVKAECPSFKILKYYGKPGRNPSRQYQASELAEFDVVISTYDTVRCAVLPNKSPKTNLVGNKLALDSPFLGIQWNHVVLDDGLNTIKNHSKGHCLSVCALFARNRWIVSRGALIRPEELFAFLKFVRLEPFCDPKIWECFMTGNDEEKRTEFGTLITKTVTLRWMAAEMFKGM